VNISLLRSLAHAFVAWTLTILLPASFLLADTTMAGTLGRATMSLPESSTVPGDMATTWRRIAAVTIIQKGDVATHLHELTDLRLLPARFHLFHHGRVLVASGHAEVGPTKPRICSRSLASWHCCSFLAIHFRWSLSSVTDSRSRSPNIFRHR